MIFILMEQNGFKGSINGFCLSFSGIAFDRGLVAVAAKIFDGQVSVTGWFTPGLKGVMTPSMTS